MFFGSWCNDYTRLVDHMEIVNQRNLAKRLKELRGERSHLDIERLSGVSRGNLTRYESGALLPRPDVLQKLAGSLNAPYRELRKLYFLDKYPPGSEDWSILLELLDELKRQSE